MQKDRTPVAGKMGDELLLCFLTGNSDSLQSMEADEVCLWHSSGECLSTPTTATGSDGSYIITQSYPFLCTNQARQEASSTTSKTTE